jgi:hypothetical protein
MSDCSEKFSKYPPATLTFRASSLRSQDWVIF